MGSILDALAKFRKGIFSFVVSVCLSVCLSLHLSLCNNSSAPDGRIFMNYGIWVFFENFVQKIKVSLQSDRNKDYVTWRCMYVCMYVYGHISLSSYQNKKYFRQKL